MQASHIFDPVDLPLLRLASRFAGKSHLFDHLVNAVSRLDIFKGIVLMSVFWYVWAEVSKPSNPNQTAQQTRLVTILIGTVLLGALSRILQVLLPIHQRPVLAPLGITFPITDFNALELNNWNSFPSDHAMFFFAFGVGLLTINRVAGWFALIWTIVAIELPRVYLGIHYPSDVIFGSLFGWLGMKLFLACPLKRMETLLTEWHRLYPGLFVAAVFFSTDEVGHLLAELRELARSIVQVLLH